MININIMPDVSITTYATNQVPKNIQNQLLNKPFVRSLCRGIINPFFVSKIFSKHTQWYLVFDMLIVATVMIKPRKTSKRKRKKVVGVMIGFFKPPFKKGTFSATMSKQSWYIDVICAGKRYPGVGSLMLNYFKNKAKKARKKNILLFAMEEALGFWSSKQFTVMKCPYDVKESGKCMKLKL